MTKPTPTQSVTEPAPITHDASLSEDENYILRCGPGMTLGCGYWSDLARGVIAKGFTVRATLDGMPAPARPDLTGKKFKSERHACVWTVLYYHRGGNWVCEEPDHHTTCHFHESEIMAGIVDPEAEDQLAQIAAEAAAVIATHEQLNRVHYYPAQRERIAREIPKHGTPEPTTSGHELAAYRMPNGSRFVTLSDGSDATWRAYCAELHAAQQPRF